MPIGSPPSAKAPDRPQTRFEGNEIISSLLPLMEARAQNTYPFIPLGNPTPAIMALLQSSFAQDTVAKLLKEKPVWVSQRGAPYNQIPGPDENSVVAARVNADSPDTIRVLSPQYFDDKTLIHETQHVNEMRNEPFNLLNILLRGLLTPGMEDRAYAVEKALAELRVGQDTEESRKLAEKLKKP